ncbi:MAG: hypothetical protein ACJAYU_005078 [Bradymonadia bacterium]|jgi:hypothetical protein
MIPSINDVLPDHKFIVVEGELEDDDLIEAFIERYPAGKDGWNLRRWFYGSPIHEDGQTWVLSNQWGVDTEDALQALITLAPNADISYTAR